MSYGAKNYVCILCVYIHIIYIYKYTNIYKNIYNMKTNEIYKIYIFQKTIRVIALLKKNSIRIDRETETETIIET